MFMPNIMPTGKRELSKRDSSRQDSWFTLYQMVEERLKEKKAPPLKAQEVVTIEDAKRVIIDLQRQNQKLRRTQLELESARKEYTDFYEIAPVGYITISEKGLILKANLTAATLLGIDRRELLKQPFYPFIRSEDQDSFYLMRKNLLQTGESQSLDLQLIGQDGTSFWTNLQTVAKLSESGKTVIRVVLSDISKRKLAEESLLKIFHQNKTILESITDAFIALSDDMVVLYFNAPAEEIFGRKQSAVIGRKIFDVFSDGKGTVFEGNCLQAYSTAGKGSRFRVFLPLAADVTHLQPDLSTEQKTQKATGTVLFVDDDPLIHKVIKTMIEHLGFSVLVAASGAEAVSVLKKQPNSIDCLLTDLSMQGMNGWETLVALRQIRPDLPAVLSSGYDEAHVMSGDHKELPPSFSAQTVYQR